MQLNKPWLVTGSRGYVGRHLTNFFGRSGFHYIGVDQKTGHGTSAVVGENELLGDINDPSFVESLLSRFDFQGVVHLAALKDVSEALREPDKYLQQNLNGSINFLKSVTGSGIDKIVFASSAAVYGNRNTDHGFVESDPLEASNPYSESKIGVENFLMNQSQNTKVKAVALRFFNIVGRVYGFDSYLDCNNLIPRIFRAVERQEDIFVYGNSFPTEDGTAIRDYVHVLDVVSAIQKAINKIDSLSGYNAFNIGTGSKTSVQKVLDLISKKLPLSIIEVAPRSGDSYSSLANIERANLVLGWEPNYKFDQILESYFLESDV
jgi:UDP-glucose 4-epimerase